MMIMIKIDKNRRKYLQKTKQQNKCVMGTDTYTYKTQQKYATEMDSNYTAIMGLRSSSNWDHFLHQDTIQITFIQNGAIHSVYSFRAFSL